MIESMGTQKGTYYFQNYYTKSRKTWFSKYNSQKRDLIVSVVSVIRSRSGHISLNESLYKIIVVDSPRCPCGDERQSLDHFILYCINCVKERKIFLEKLAKIKIFILPPFSVSTFLVKPDIKVMILLIEFTKNCNLVI